ncbi:MAG: 5-formyltetrahydrofolate cyclo-ligase [Acidimicrobiales bacterium]
MTDTGTARRAMRLELRFQRAGLDDDDQAAASMAVLTRLARLPVLRAARLVAGYRATQGEIDIDAALVLLHDWGATVTVPRVEGDDLAFLPWEPDTQTRPGAFGIPEPVGGRSRSLARHDIVLAPLVAFDDTGRRLGQGGGFYDRALAACADSRPSSSASPTPSSRWHGFPENRGTSRSTRWSPRNGSTSSGQAASIRPSERAAGRRARKPAVHVIVVGAGEVGSYVADRLSREGHDVAIIDPDVARLRQLADELDVLTIRGSGTHPSTLRRAGIDAADLLVAVTSNDEVNLISSLLAKSIGVSRTIVRIEAAELRNAEAESVRTAAGADLIIDPDAEAAAEVLEPSTSPARTRSRTWREARSS